MTVENGYEAEKQLQFVSDSVLAFAYGLKALHADLCGGARGLCPRMNPIDGAVLLNYVKNVSFKGGLYMILAYLLNYNGLIYLF